MESVIIILSFFRGPSAQKLYRISKLTSIRIQSMWHCKSVLHTCRLRSTSIIVVQAKFRGFITRSRNANTSIVDYKDSVYYVKIHIGGIIQNMQSMVQRNLYKKVLRLSKGINNFHPKTLLSIMK